MRNFRIVCVAVVVVAAVALSAGAGTSTAGVDMFDVPVTGTLGGQPFTGTLQLHEFSATADGKYLYADIAGIVDENGKPVAEAQELALAKLVIAPTHNNSSKNEKEIGGIGFSLGPVKTLGGATLVVAPVWLEQNELAPGAAGRLRTLSHAVIAPTNVHAVLALLDGTFGLIVAPDMIVAPTH